MDSPRRSLRLRQKANAKAESENEQETHRTDGATAPSLSKAPPQGRPHFTLVREFSLADLITIGNAVCGASSIFLCLNYLENDQKQIYIHWAFGLLPIALICDIFDGHIARCRQASSPYGADLDSLADLISFGVAPAVLGFTLGLRGFWDSAILCFFVSCGLARLARFNVTAEQISAGTGKVPYYEGLPIPFSLGIVALLYFAFCQGAIQENFVFGKEFYFIGHFHPATLIYGVLGCLMISTVRIPKP
mmetsp:Transcript_26208/g.51695  ORF Transcript_26208/g.51695 Transcript_26208/m.51695 type:complete len:248 (-) Transcript_26208:2400-3143(-)